MLHPLGAMDICANWNGNQSKSCWDIGTASMQAYKQGWSTLVKKMSLGDPDRWETDGDVYTDKETARVSNSSWSTCSPSAGGFSQVFPNSAFGWHLDRVAHVCLATWQISANLLLQRVSPVCIYMRLCVCVWMDRSVGSRDVLSWIEWAGKLRKKVKRTAWELPLCWQWSSLNWTCLSFCLPVCVLPHFISSPPSWGYWIKKTWRHHQIDFNMEFVRLIAGQMSCQ